MKNKMRFYLVWILVITNLFYAEVWGLNALLAAILTVLLLGWKERRLPGILSVEHTRDNTIQWWIGALAWLLAATGVFLGGTVFAGFIYLVTFGYFVSLQQQVSVSVPAGLFHAVQSGLTGIYRFFAYFVSRPQEEATAQKNKWIRQLLLFMIPLAVLVIFLKLYQVADPDFYELTKFINLDWISWGVIIVYLVLMVFLFGAFFYQPSRFAGEVESKLKNDIRPDYTDRIQAYFGIQYERRLAVSMLVVLNLMLVLYLALDFKFIFTELNQLKPDAFYSKSVHAGIEALIFSIVLVILLITFLFRGAMNFEGNKIARTLALAWLLLNCAVVLTTAVKNYEYVDQLGLTYLRLGVYFYLLLCLAGLAFTIYKILRVRSAWFLARRMSFVFLLVFALIPLVNWDRLITNYNIAHVDASRLDLEYLYSLGPQSYPPLMDYLVKNNMTNTEFANQLANTIIYEVEVTKDRNIGYSWRSYVHYDAVLLKELMRYHITFENANSAELQTGSR